MTVAFLLIAMGFGYKIYIEANSQKKRPVKTLGRVIAIFIIVIAALGTVCKITKQMSGASSCSTSSLCCLHGKAKGLHGKQCPFGIKGLKTAGETDVKEAVEY